jgi:hypothetical protein
LTVRVVVAATLCWAESFTKTLTVNVPVAVGLQVSEEASWVVHPAGSPAYA